MFAATGRIDIQPDQVKPSTASCSPHRINIAHLE